jgi:hypothetical protein
VPAASASSPSVWEQNLGWIVGLIVVLGVLGFGATAWFMYHP